MKSPASSPKPWLGFVVLCLLLTQLACKAALPMQNTEPQAPEPTVALEYPTAAPVKSTQPPQDTPEAAPSPTPLSSQDSGQAQIASGLACFGTLSLGMNCLGPTGWQSFDRDNSPLDSNSILDIAACPDGKIAIIGSQGVAAFDGAVWKEYPADLSAVIGADGIACDANNTFWVAFMSGISHWDGKDWTTYPSEQVTPGGAAAIFTDIAVAPDGTVWAISSSSVSKFAGNTWTAFMEGQGFSERYYISSLALDKQGQPWVGYSNGLLHYDGENWQTVRNPDTATINALAFDSQGRIWEGSSTNGLYLFEGGGWTQYDLTGEAGASNNVRSVTVDARDRVWVSTEYGLAILDGAVWKAFHMHTADLIENDLHNLAVTGNGPDLLEPTQKAPGILNARVVDSAGLPVANAPVEVCVLTLGPIFSGETPCSDQPYLVKSQTDADGNFSFSDLPAGYYIITIYAKGGWSQLVGEFGSFSERVLIRAGLTTDIGDITLQE